MRLRSLTKHIREQNWIAVAIDFLVVVAGILLAFQITNWSEGRREKVNLTRAETALSEDLIANYLNAKTNVAVTQCRKNTLRDLGARLLEGSDEWAAVSVGSWDQDDQAWFAFPPVLNLPKHSWNYSVWDDEQARGSFDSMDTARRKDIDDLFVYVRLIETFTFEMVTTESRLMILNQNTVLTRTEKNRLFEFLAEADFQGVALGQIGRNIVRDTEALTLQLTRAQIDAMRNLVALRNERYSEVYGDCFAPITTPFLDEVESGETP